MVGEEKEPHHWELGRQIQRAKAMFNLGIPPVRTPQTLDEYQEAVEARGFAYIRPLPKDPVAEVISPRETPSFRR